MNPWPTPTPMPTPSAGPPVDPFSGMEFVLAENLVQGYQQANNFGALDMLMFALLVFLVVGGIWSIMAHVKRL